MRKIFVIIKAEALFSYRNQGYAAIEKNRNPIVNFNWRSIRLVLSQSAIDFPITGILNKAM